MVDTKIIFYNVIKTSLFVFKKLMIISMSFFTLSIIYANLVFSQTRQYGAGIIIGEPTGISLKYWLNGDSALDFALAWSFSGDDSFHLHGDYLIHNFELLKVPEGRLPLYYGVGARYLSREEHHHNNHHNDNHTENLLGVRLPAGLDYIFAEIPLDIFLEIVPVVNLIPDTGFDLDFALGVRYFF